MSKLIAYDICCAICGDDLVVTEDAAERAGVLRIKVRPCVACVGQARAQGESEGWEAASTESYRDCQGPLADVLKKLRYAEPGITQALLDEWRRRRDEEEGDEP